MALSWAAEAFTFLVSRRDRAPEKRKVGGSTPPLTTAYEQRNAPSMIVAGKFLSGAVSVWSSRSGLWPRWRGIRGPVGEQPPRPGAAQLSAELGASALTVGVAAPSPPPEADV